MLTKQKRTIRFLAGQRGVFSMLFNGSKTLHMTLQGFGEIFEGDFADTCPTNIRWSRCEAERKVAHAHARSIVLRYQQGIYIATYN